MANQLAPLRLYGPPANSLGGARFMPRTGYRVVWDNVAVPGFDDQFSYPDIQVGGLNSFMVVSTVTAAGAFDVFCYIGHPEDSSAVAQRTNIHHAGPGTILKPWGAFAPAGFSDVWFTITFEYFNGVAGARSYTLKLLGTKR